MGVLRVTSIALLLVCMVLSPVASSVFSRNLNEVGFRIQKNLGGRDNLFISPISIYFALAMTHLGAQGETREQLEKVLRVRDQQESMEELHKVSRIMTKVYSEKWADYTVSLANALFVQKDFTVKPSFVDSMRNLYMASVKNVDFAREGEEAKREINEWAAEKTHNKIENFLGEPLDPSTALALLNAVYFKATWQTQFNTSETFVGSFYKPNNEVKEVKFMQLKKATLFYYEDKETGYKILEMPYKDYRMSMYLALPMNDNEFPDLEMTSDILARFQRKSRKMVLRKVVVPKFHLEYQSELKDALQALGIKDLFGSDADLTGISGQGNLQVSSVVHKAVVDVTEEGSEAAAVSGVVITYRSGFVGPEFIANRPFLFFIVDNVFDIALFSGRVVNP